MCGCAVDRVTWHSLSPMLVAVTCTYILLDLSYHLIAQAFNATEEIQSAGDYSNIRLFTAALEQSDKEEKEFLNITQPWQVASPGMPM